MPKYVQRYLDCIKRNPYYAVLLITVLFLSLVVIMPSGSQYCIQDHCGLFFWGAHEHDGIWHIALIESAFKSWPFTLPIYAGAKLAGYNFLFDFVISLFTRVGISSLFLYFKVQPILWAICFFYAVYRLGINLFRTYKENTLNTSVKSPQLLQVILLFSVTLLGSFGPVFMLLRQGSIWGGSGIFAMQGPVGMTNPQYMWSLVVLVLLLNRCLDLVQKTKSNIFDLLAIGALVGLGFALKAYSVPAMMWILGFAISSMMVKKQWGKALSVGVSACFGFLTIYFTQYAGGIQGGFVWDPFSLVRSMYSDPRVFQNDQVMLEWFQLKEIAPNSLRLWKYYLGASLTYTISTFGMRVLGFGLLFGLIRDVVRRIKITQTSLFGAVCMIGAIATCLPGLLLIQKGVWWNTVQFFYFSQFLASIGFAIWLWQLSKNKRLLFASVAGLTLFLSACFLTDSLYSFFLPQTASHISSSELNVLATLKRLPEGVVYVQPYNEENKKNTPDAERTLPDMIDTAYVSAISGKQTYFANETQLELLNIAYKSRQEKLRSHTCDHIPPVTYAYLRRRDFRYSDTASCMSSLGFKKSASNEDAELWINQNDIHKIEDDQQKQ